MYFFLILNRLGVLTEHIIDLLLNKKMKKKLILKVDAVRGIPLLSQENKIFDFSDVLVEERLT